MSSQFYISVITPNVFDVWDNLFDGLDVRVVWDSHNRLFMGIISARGVDPIKIRQAEIPVELDVRSADR